MDVSEHGAPAEGGYTLKEYRANKTAAATISVAAGTSKAPRKEKANPAVAVAGDNVSYAITDEKL